MTGDVTLLVLMPLVGDELHEVGLALLRYHHTFGFSRRARGINHIGDAVGLGEVCIVRPGTVAMAKEIVEEDHLPLIAVEVAVGILLVINGMRCDEHLALRILQHIEQTVVGIVIVERHIGAAGFLDADGGYEELLLVAHHDAHEGRLALACPYINKVGGKTAGQVVELGIGVGAARVCHGCVLRSLPCLAHKERDISVGRVNSERSTLRQGKDFFSLPGSGNLYVFQGRGET